METVLNILRGTFAEKYCKLVEEEGGLVLLEELINSNVEPPMDEGGSTASEARERVVNLAAIVRENVAHWRQLRREDDGLDDQQQDLDLDG